jgi:hypothetical protein
MKVYGDAEQSVDFQQLLSSLNERLAATDTTNLESVRALLIEAGQVEQAVADCSGELGHELVADCEQLTDWAAEQFCALYFDSAPQRHCPSPLHFERGSKKLTVKIPEGFAFYALYPEQYCLSAARWSEQQHRAKTAIVIGLRSIGTTLSAVVNATLRLKGWNSNRFTVRASGHPFNRSVELPQLPTTSYALVVDEGPGMSGSSMAAVAQAFLKKGFHRNQIVFFPAHDNGPGDAAPDNVRKCWSSVRIVTTKLDDARWRRQTLQEQLREACNATSIVDCSAGLWRKVAYENENHWPAVGPQFERVKYLCRTDRGSILWKYIGLSPSVAEPMLEQMHERAEKTDSPTPLRICNGFVAMPWIQGERLTTSSSNNEILQTLARYIAASAQEPLPASKAKCAIERLKDMTVFNCREALGDEFDPRAEKYIRAAQLDLTAASYGDGRMATHEWVRDSAGLIWKTDSVGNNADHTLVGKQSVCWDIAGAIVEWNMDDTTTEQFVAKCSSKITDISEEELLFYQFAYAAFRLGFCTLNQSLTDEHDQRRLRTAAEFYGMRLSRLIRTSFSKSVSMLTEPGLISTRDI